MRRSQAVVPQSLKLIRVARLGCMSAAVSVLIACGDRAREHDVDGMAITRADSGGVALIAYPADDALQRIAPLQLDSPYVRVTGEQVLALDDVRGIGGGVLRTGGGFALGVSGTQELLYFDSTGTRVRTVGRRGSGPEEFRRMRGPWPAPNHALVLYDTELHRTSVVDSTGVFVAGSSFAAPPDAQRMITAAINTTGNGQVLARVDVASPSMPGHGRDTFELRLLDPVSGTSTAVAGRYAGRERFVAPPASGRAMLATSPFARNSLVTACGQWIHIADNMAFVLKRYRLDGALDRVVDLQRVGQSIEDAHFAAAVSRQTGGAVIASAELIASLREMTSSRTLPVIESIRCDDGSIWVEEFTAGASERRILHFDTQLALRSWVSVPIHQVILDVRTDRILVARSGTDDVAVIEVRPLRRGR